MVSCDINQLVSDMVDFYLPQAQNQGVTIRLGLFDESIVCKIDTGMIKQVILNLFIKKI